VFFERKENTAVIFRVALGSVTYKIPYRRFVLSPADPDQATKSTRAAPVVKAKLEPAPGASATVFVDDGSILAAKSVRPSSSFVKVVLMDGTEKTVASYKVKAILDATGKDRTKDVLDRLKQLP
jgi:hypothetical protein